MMQDNQRRGLECCEKCAGKLVHDPDAGEMVCSGCGLVAVERTEEEEPSPSMREQLGDLEKSSQFGYLDLKASSLGKGYTGTDANGGKIDQGYFKRLKHIETLAITANNRGRIRSIEKGTKLAERLADDLRLTKNVTENALFIYRKAKVLKLLKGRSVPAVIGACMFLAAKQAGTMRSLHEVKAALARNSNNVSSKGINSVKWILQQNLNIESKRIPLTHLISKVSGGVTATSGEQLSQKMIRIATRIVELMEKDQVVQGKHPVAVVAASFYIASIICNEPIRHGQMGFAMAAGVSVVSIRKHVMYQLPVLEKNKEGFADMGTTLDRAMRTLKPDINIDLS